jgi:hypothetical protein
VVLDRKKLAVIHIVKRELGLSDDDYRNILERETGVRSAKDMDERGFFRLMRYFTASGYYRINRDGMTFRQKLYIKHLVDDLGWNANHFQNFLNKYYHKTELDKLSKPEASKVIESLKNILRHSSTGCH